MQSYLPPYSIVQPVLSRIRVHYLESASHVSFSLSKKIHTYLVSTHPNTKITYLFYSQNIYVSAYGVPKLLLQCTCNPYLLLADAEVIFCFFRHSTRLHLS